MNCCSWNRNGNWLASGSKDGLVKIYDIRTMREVEVLRGQNSDICSLGWHPQHESLLLTGGYNGSLIYWIVGGNQAPHTMIADAHRQVRDTCHCHHRAPWRPACVGMTTHVGQQQQHHHVTSPPLHLSDPFPFHSVPTAAVD